MTGKCVLYTLCNLWLNTYCFNRVGGGRRREIEINSSEQQHYLTGRVEVVFARPIVPVRVYYYYYLLVITRPRPFIIITRTVYENRHGCKTMPAYIGGNIMAEYFFRSTLANVLIRAEHKRFFLLACVCLYVYYNYYALYVHIRTIILLSRT